MGFGWLFIGYFVATLMSINSFGFLFWLIGYGIVFMAAKKLSAYHKDFRYLCMGSLLMLLVSAIVGFSQVTTFLYEQMILDTRIISKTLDTVLSFVKMGAELLFHVSLLWPIRAIAKETEVEKISVSAVRNFIFMMIYYVLYTIATLPFAALKGFAAAFMMPIILLYLVCLILNAVLIGSCYARICDPADLEMEQKPSRFAFVNRMREEAAARRLKKDAEFAEREREKKERKKEKKRK